MKVHITAPNVLMWAVPLMAAFILMAGHASAAESVDVVGEGSTGDVCWFSRETALGFARSTAKEDARNDCLAKGPGWRITGVKFEGYEQCAKCDAKKDYDYRCNVTKALFICTGPEKKKETKKEENKAEKAADTAANQAEAQKKIWMEGLGIILDGNAPQGQGKSIGDLLDESADKEIVAKMMGDAPKVRTQARNDYERLMRGLRDKEAERESTLKEYREGAFCSGCGKTRSEILAKGEHFPHAGQHEVPATEAQLRQKDAELSKPIQDLQSQLARQKTVLEAAERDYQERVKKVETEFRLRGEAAKPTATGGKPTQPATNFLD